MEFISNTLHTPVTEEILRLASNRTDNDLIYKDKPYDTYRKSFETRVIKDVRMGSIWARSSFVNQSQFWAEFNRLKVLVREPLEEPILPNNYVLEQKKIYIVDGEQRVFADGHGITVGVWKNMTIAGEPKINEVRKMDYAGRILRARAIETKDKMRIGLV